MIVTYEIRILWVDRIVMLGKRVFLVFIIITYLAHLTYQDSKEDQEKGGKIIKMSIIREIINH